MMLRIWIGEPPKLNIERWRRITLRSSGAADARFVFRGRGWCGGPLTFELSRRIVAGLKRSEIPAVVNRYIGVSSGYLGDFTYRSHAEFYPEFCDLDVSGIDRMHTAFHGFLKALCERTQVVYPDGASVTQLYSVLRREHPALRDMGTHAQDIDRILKSFASAVDSLNALRNQASVAHPNAVLLEREEAYLYVNAVRTLMAYLDAKLSNVANG